jgi:ABC-2 type transport system permease protein
MTIITSTIPAPTSSRYRLGAVMRSEWTKMRSVRSTTRTIALTVVLTIGIGMIAAATEANRWKHASAATRLIFDPTNLSLTGILFGQLMVGLLGVLVVSAEYGTGTIRASLSAVPNRGVFLVAKTTTFAVVALLVGEFVSFVSFFAGQSIIGGGAPHATISQPGVLGAVIGSGLYLILLGLLAVGLGLIIRHTAGAIAAFVGILLIVPLLTPAFPSSIGNAISKFEPTTIGNAITVTNPHLPSGSVPTFKPWVGLAILSAYAAVALGIGGWRLVRRDA